MIKAWYFSRENKKLRYSDNRIIRTGITHKVKCEPILCEAGLHGSRKILDALSYAPGAYVWRVELSGEIIRGADKIAATERKYLWGYDSSDILRRFGRLCALDVLHLWEAPAIVIEYLKTGNESIRAAARDAARAAARDTAIIKQNNRLTQMIIKNRP